MGDLATLQAARFTMRKNSRSRRFAIALPLHRAGLVITAAGQYVQDDEGNGQPWVSLGTGTTGATPLDGSDTVINDGGVAWAKYSGRLLVAPPHP